MTEHPVEQSDRTPRPNPILAEPATVELAQRDYADGADIRGRLDQQIKAGR